MKRFLILLLSLVCTSACAEEFYYVVDALTLPPPPGTATFASPDDACKAAYKADADGFIKNLNLVQLPYVSPTLEVYLPPSIVTYSCTVSGHSPELGQDFSKDHVIYRQGDGCTDDQTYNPLTDQCESPSDDQDRKEEGDPSNTPLSGPTSCVGDPINAAVGNEFEAETDFQDTDGELRFVRYYNTIDGKWRHSYGASIVFSSQNGTMPLTFEDGRVSLFHLVNNVATAESTELGHMALVGSQWVYTSPDNQRYSFDFQGRLTKWQQANGLSQTLTYSAPSNGVVTATVTDSRGHTLQFAQTSAHVLTGLTTGNMATTYAYDSFGMLSAATRTWPNRTTIRSYVYEDTRNHTWLTGVIDELGLRFSTWHYDDQGRAISSEHAGGAEKVTLTYNSDGSTSLTNALGNSITYRYQVIQGLKHITAIEGQPAVGCPASNSSYTYTDRGQVATKTDALGHITAHTYDAVGREITRIEARGTPQERTTTMTWNGATFLPTTVTTPDRAITYSYDAQGRLLSTSVHGTKE